MFLLLLWMSVIGSQEVEKALPEAIFVTCGCPAESARQHRKLEQPWKCSARTRGFIEKGMAL